MRAYRNSAADGGDKDANAENGKANTNEEQPTPDKEFQATINSKTDGDRKNSGAVDDNESPECHSSVMDKEDEEERKSSTNGQLKHGSRINCQLRALSFFPDKFFAEVAKAKVKTSEYAMENIKFCILLESRSKSQICACLLLQTGRRND